MKRVGAWLQTKPVHHGSTKSLTALDEQQARELRPGVTSVGIVLICAFSARCSGIWGADYERW